jgi:hypothetical protein
VSWATRRKRKGRKPKVREKHTKNIFYKLKYKQTKQKIGSDNADTGVAVAAVSMVGPSQGGFEKQTPKLFVFFIVFFLF